MSCPHIDGTVIYCAQCEQEARDKLSRTKKMKEAIVKAIYYFELRNLGEPADRLLAELKDSVKGMT